MTNYDRLEVLSLPNVILTDRLDGIANSYDKIKLSLFTQIVSLLNVLVVLDLFTIPGQLVF